MTNDELRALAEKTMPGPWKYWADEIHDANGDVVISDDYVCGDAFDYILAASPDRVISLLDDNESLRARVKALEEALRPSAATKAAYIGEFSFPGVIQYTNDEGQECEDHHKICVPWTTIKEIMAAIRARAALEGK